MYPSQTDYAGQQQLNTCGANTPNPSMTLHKFHGQNSPKCTDGSPASYYLLKRPESREWVIYLPGGAFCADKESCLKRLSSDIDLTSSSSLSHCKQGMGILSTNEVNNYHFHKANMVYIPY